MFTYCADWSIIGYHSIYNPYVIPNRHSQDQILHRRDHTAQMFQSFEVLGERGNRPPLQKRGLCVLLYLSPTITLHPYPRAWCTCSSTLTRFPHLDHLRDPSQVVTQRLFFLCLELITKILDSFHRSSPRAFSCHVWNEYPHSRWLTLRKFARYLVFVVLRTVAKPCVVPGHGVCGGTLNSCDDETWVRVECD